MGLGKTVQVIALLLSLKQERGGKKGDRTPDARVLSPFFPRCGEKGKVAPSLLIVPASLIANWKAEIERFAPSLHYVIVHPSEPTADELSATDLEKCELVIT